MSKEEKESSDLDSVKSTNETGTVVVFDEYGNRLRLKKNEIFTQQLIEAAYEGNVEELKELIVTQGVNPNDKSLLLDDFNQASALHFAKNAAVVDCLRQSSSYDLDINIQDAEGSTPLMYAIIEQRQEIVFKLLSLNADIHIRNKNGEDALSLATKAVQQAANYNPSAECASDLNVHEHACNILDKIKEKRSLQSTPTLHHTLSLKRKNNIHEESKNNSGSSSETSLRPNSQAVLLTELGINAKRKKEEEEEEHNLSSVIMASSTTPS